MLLRQRKASSNFLNIFTPPNTPGVLYCLGFALGLQQVVQWAFLGGIFSWLTICQCHYLHTHLTPDDLCGKRNSRNTLLLMEAALGCVSAEHPWAFIGWGRRREGRRWWKAGLELLRVVVPGICCPGFTRTGSSSLDWFVSCNAFYVETWDLFLYGVFWKLWKMVLIDFLLWFSCM